MIPGKWILDRIGNSIGIDADLLADLDHAPKVCLVSGDFSPGEALAVTDVTIINSNGLEALTMTAGGWESYRDPTSGDIIVEGGRDAGTFLFRVSTDPDSNIECTGYIVTNDAKTIVLFSERFPETVTFSTAGQAIEVPMPRFTIPATAIK